MFPAVHFHFFFGTPLPERLGEYSESTKFDLGQWSRCVTVTLNQPVSPLHVAVWLDPRPRALLALSTCVRDQVAHHARAAGWIVKRENHAETSTSIPEHELDLPPAVKGLASHRG